jgi:hypothetical protein
VMRDSMRVSNGITCETKAQLHVRLFCQINDPARSTHILRQSFQSQQHHRRSCQTKHRHSERELNLHLEVQSTVSSEKFQFIFLASTVTARHDDVTTTMMLTSRLLRSCTYHCVLFVQIDFIDTTEQIEETLSALWEAIGSPNKPFLKFLAFAVGDLASANTVETRDQDLEIISRHVLHPETLEQSSDAVRFISMLREGSISTINEVKALLDTALSVQVLAEVAEEDVHVPEQVQDTSGDVPTSSPMDVDVDNLGQDSDSDRMSVSDCPSDSSSNKSMPDGTDTPVEAMTGVEPVL